MTLLGDLLSEKSIESFAESLVNVGGVYFFSLTEEDGITPKNPGETFRNKFFVIIGVDKEKNIGYLILNTDVNIHKTTEEKNCQFLVHGCDYDFLKHDSFIDCSTIREMTMARFTEVLCRHQVGMIQEKDLDAVFGIINYTSTPKLLKRFNLI